MYHKIPDRKPRFSECAPLLNLEERVEECSTCDNTTEDNSLEWLIWEHDNFLYCDKCVDYEEQ